MKLRIVHFYLNVESIVSQESVKEMSTMLNVVTGGITILRDYAAEKATEITRKAVIRFETEPGYQAQVDWKILGKRLVDGRWKKLYVFVMVFGYSRKPFVIHTTSKLFHFV